MAEVDVVVIGGGPAGIAAAVAAAEEGASTILIEQTGCLGGMATSGLVPSFCPFSDGHNWVAGGVGRTLMEQVKSRVSLQTPAQRDWVPIDAESLKRLAETRVLSSGARIRYFTTFTSVRQRNGEVEAALLWSKAGLEALRARIFVDATGDADLSARAGAECLIGDARGRCQPMTLCFLLTNVNVAAWRAAVGDRDAIAAAEELLNRLPQGTLSFPERRGNLAIINSSTVGINFGHVFDRSGLKPDDLTEAIIRGRAIAAELTEAFRACLPGFEDAHLAATASLMGVRETRRIVGDVVLTVDDWLQRRDFPDEVARNAYGLDQHRRPEDDCSDLAGMGWTDCNRYPEYRPGESHGIPYGALLPRGLKNVLVAGRCISSDRLMQSSLRNMPTCFATGEAAGTAAALACRQHTFPRGISVTELQDALRARGCVVGPPIEFRKSES